MRGSFPSVQEKQHSSPYYVRGPVWEKPHRLIFREGFFLEPSIPYTSEALKKENVKENLWKARLEIRQFSPFNCLFSIE
jgi:hypothetical protein